MRYLIIALGLVVLIGALATVKYKQISQLIAFGKTAQKNGPPPEAVATAAASEQTWEAALAAVGTLAPSKGVSIGNEVPGTVVALHFESGAKVKQGQVLVELDSSVERAQLGSIEARKELATVNARRTQALVESRAIAPAQLDTDRSVLKTSSADLGALRAQIDRKVVRAPFSGRLGIRQVNVGQYLTPGTVIASLEATDSLFVDFSLPQQQVSVINVGMPVHVTIEGGAVPAADGVVAAIDPAVDASTRSVKIRATVPNGDERLRPGMFANVALVLPTGGKVVTVPASALIHASYGDSVFVIEDKKDESGRPVMGQDGRPAKVARQQFVRTGESRGDFTSVVEGVTAGQEVVVAGAFKLRNNASVVVNNDIRPDAQINPHVANH